MTPVGDDEFAELSRREPGPDRANAGVVVGAAVVAAVGGMVFAWSVLTGAQVLVPGTALAVALFALAVAVRRFFAGSYPSLEAAEPRSIGSASSAPLTDVEPVREAKLVRRTLLAGGALFTATLLAPVAVLGPRPGPSGTAWRRGVRLVDSDGEPLLAEQVPLGGVATVWPEGSQRPETAATILVALMGMQPRPPTNLDWVVDERLVAYSKLCTHMGCPVGLFQERGDSLFCPCHQATFDASAGAVPTFGPPARPLPQLPLGVDADGYLVALGDFPAPVGPTTG